VRVLGECCRHIPAASASSSRASAPAGVMPVSIGGRGIGGTRGAGAGSWTRRGGDRSRPWPCRSSPWPRVPQLIPWHDQPEGLRDRDVDVWYARRMGRREQDLLWARAAAGRRARSMGGVKPQDAVFTRSGQYADVLDVANSSLFIELTSDDNYGWLRVRLASRLRQQS